MKTISRYIMTLALLLTAVGGAWAQGIATPVISGETEFYDEVTVTITCATPEVDIYFTRDGSDPKDDSWSSTAKEYKNAFTLTETTTVKAAAYSGDAWSAIVEVTFTKVQGPIVTINDTKTEASFDMPTYDVNVNYELVRDMASKVDVQVIFNNEETTRLRIAKDGNGKYQLANGWKFIAYDNIDANNPVSLDGQVIYTFKKKNAEGGYDAIDTYHNGYSTGTWRLEAEGMENGNYAGIAYGKDITLYEGYDLTLTSAQASSVAVTIGDAAVTPEQGGRIQGVETGKSVKLSVSEGYMFSDMFTGYKVNFTPAGDALAWTKVGCYYWGNHGDGNLFNPVQWPGVEMTKNGNNWETTINVNGLTNIIFNDFQTNNQQTSDLPFASGAADNLGSYTIADAVEMTYNNAKTEATFSMPASDVGMSFNVKRNLSVKTAAEMAERIRINKTGDTYSPIQMTDVQPTVTNNLDAQNPVVLEFGKDYSTTLQKKGEGQDEWIDTQNYGVGTYRLMVTGNGEYGGTCYTNEFELYAGYEVTVAAGEYATFYKDEIIYTEDEDAELYTISSVSDTEAVLSDKLAMVAANTPMLVYNKGTEAKTFILLPSLKEDAGEVTVAREFRGTLAEKEMPASSTTVDYYVCTGKAFIWVKDAGVIDANRCWLQIGEQVAAARAMTRSIVGGGNTTNMDDVRWQMEDGNYYDLQGRKVEKPNRKGIYIHNGKKVIVR